MHVLMTGATGFVGRALVLRLARDGHTITALVRSPQSAAGKLGAGVTVVDIGDAGAVDSAMANAQGVVNLAGESVATRWTAKRKEELRRSRIDTTRLLVESAKRSGAKLAAIVSASAVGVYGDAGETPVNEATAPGHDFLASLCVAWEGAAREAEALGARVAVMRLGVVLGDGGGALAKIIPMFKGGIGGKLGDGTQWFSWVHLQDVCDALARALVDDRYRGIINVTAPHPVTNAAFTKALGHILGRPTIVTTPKLAVRLALGEAATAVLASQRVLPKRLQELGFVFTFPELDGALADVTHTAPTVTVRPIERQSTHGPLR